jgi:hypothetical protein
VFNPKVSGIIAGVAFILSFLIGLFTGSQFFPVFLRAFILAVIFFVLASLAYWLISQFLPELLHSPSDESGEIDVPGSKVDISIDSSNDDSALGSINGSAQESLASDSERSVFSRVTTPVSAQGLDQKPQDDYNMKGEGLPGDLTKSTAVPDEDASAAIDVLPDLESMSGSFASPADSEEESDVVEMEDDLSSSAPSFPEPSRTKKQSDPGDFNVQEMASAIQTILRRDEKG